MFNRLKEANSILSKNFGFYFLNYLSVLIVLNLMDEIVNRTSGFVNFIFLVIQFILVAYMFLTYIETIIRKRFDPSIGYGDFAQLDFYKYEDRRFRLLNYIGANFIQIIATVFIFAIFFLAVLGSSFLNMIYFEDLSLPTLTTSRIIISAIVFPLINIFIAAFIIVTPYLALSLKRYSVWQQIKESFLLVIKNFGYVFMISLINVLLIFLIFLPILLPFALYYDSLYPNVSAFLFGIILAFGLSIYIAPLISIFNSYALVDLVKKNYGLDDKDFLSNFRKYDQEIFFE